MKPVLLDTEKSKLVIRLERNQRDLDQLKNKLNAYTCEPKTPSLFERIEQLKNGLENLSASNVEILRNLKEKKKAADNYLDSIKDQFVKFNQLQANVEEYIVGARQC